MTKVLVLHRVNLLRSALAALLTAEPSFDVTSADWGTEASYSGQPDVCVIDLDCPHASRVLRRDPAAINSLVSSRSALVVLAAADRPGGLRPTYEAGVRGYVDKDADASRLIHAIHKVAQGEQFVDGALGPSLLAAKQMPLTRGELGVLARAAQGDSNAEIAHQMNLSHGTVRNYLCSVTRKIGARNRIDAIRIMQGAGWI